MLPTLHGERCTLRPWNAGDIPELPRLADNRRVARNLTHLFPHPYSINDAVAWVALNTSATPRLFAFAIEVEGKLAGGCGVSPFDGVFHRTAEIGYWLGEPFWGKGIATDATRAAVAWAFEDRKFARLEAGVFEWNPASMRVLEKNGFRREGVVRKSVEKDGRLLDRVLFGRLASDPG
jgi:RimJ/RimL family protein N-acetyltransferase